MRKSPLIFPMILLSGTLVLASILDFFPSGHDYFFLIDGAKTFYEGVKSLPFFEFLLGEKGLGFEGVIVKTLVQRVSDPTPILLAFSNRILVAGKGRYDLADLLKFDVEHYINFPRKLNERVLVVEFEGDFVKFLEAFSKFLGMSVQGRGDTFVLRDKNTSLFLKRFGKYLVVSAEDINALEFTTWKPQGDVFGTIELDGKGRVFGYFKDLDFMGRSGEAFLKGEIKGLFLEIVLEHKVVGDVLTTTNESMVFLPFFGDLYVRVPAAEARGLEMFLVPWFVGNRRELAKLEDIFKLIGTRTHGNVFIVGNLWDPPSLTVFFRGVRLKELGNDLVKYGAVKKRGEEMELYLGETPFKIYEYRDFLVFSSVERDALVRAFERRTLGDHPSYQFFLSRFSSTGEGICVFVDVGRVIGKLVGLKVSASFVLIQHLRVGKITYRMGVM